MLDRSAVTDELRARVRAELPEVEEIHDPALAAKVVEAWALALASSSFGAIAEIEPSGNPGVNTLKRGSQTDHIRGVTRMAMALADQLSGLLPDLRIRRDIVIAGGLCHDIGKPWEFDPENRPLGGRATPRGAALDPSSGLWRARLPDRGPARGGGALRRGALRRGRVAGPLAREHHRPPRRLCVLGDLPGGRPSGARKHRHAQGPALTFSGVSIYIFEGGI